MTVADKSYRNAFARHENLFKSDIVKRGWDVVWMACVWWIWLAANRAVFHGGGVEAERIFDLIQARSFQWIKERTLNCGFSLANWSRNSVDSLKDRAGK
ncbi:hypothetical protein SLA2020_195250 [Shorea laevis]